ncbi:hypothetical protein N7492_002195 [Penicillium capsulatum]|uniref:Uncharacterized protein n=1 Tax=Penicillium capsulatum TaxID=69766 RepID=A0A9W9II50_9EURO|nr:hypothetical protein N7492_002195 [Penicillium capsulatum]
MPVKIPYAYADLLVEEHGARSLSNTEFHDHQFDETSKAWEEMKRKMKHVLRRGLHQWVA